MGEKYLQAYADELQRYQNMLNQFFDMYSKMFHLYLFPFRKEGEEEEKNNQPQGRALDEPERKKRIKTQYVSDALVDALWNSYEALVSHTRQQ